MAGAALVELRAVKKGYRRDGTLVPVLHGVSLTVGRGERLALMGRSGSGKSTLLNLLGCLDVPDEGQYLLEGREVSGLSDEALSRMRNQTFGFVFQAFHLLKGLSVLENVLLPTEYGSLGEKERTSRALELLDWVGLSHRVTHRPNELSGGERQRVAIARALVNQPKLLLADEPTGALDTRSQEAIVALFQSVHATFGTTLVTVTHDPAVAAALGDRVVHVSDGRIAVDSPRPTGAWHHAVESSPPSSPGADALALPDGASRGQARTSEEVA